MQLNKEQQEAVRNVAGPSVILAGAGSGKTRVLIQKVLYMIEHAGVQPRQILMITFTNKAALEMKKRMGSVKLGFVGTFHAFCARMLRIEGDRLGLSPDFVIYDEADQLQLIKSIIKKMHTQFSPGYFLNRISTAKNELISPESYRSIFSDYSAEVVADVYEQYQKKLRSNTAVDFDDLLVLAHQLLKQSEEVRGKYQRTFTHLLIDEFQDTNTAQYQIATLLAGTAQNITVVGDFSQSIYSWRGADIRNLEKFKKDFENCKEFYLEQNYRSTQQILDYAYSIISQNTTHPILQLRATSKSGEEVIVYEAFDEQDESFFVIDEIKRSMRMDPDATLGVLYRTNAQSRIIEETFLHEAVPYVLIGGTRFYERKEVKDILAYLRCLVNPNDELSVERAQKIGKSRYKKLQSVYLEIKDRVKDIPTAELMEQVFQATGYLDLYNVNDPEDYSRLENIKELKSVALRFPHVVEFLEQVALVESEYSEQEKQKHADKTAKPGVNLMTLHQAKGLEFDYVWIVGLEEGLLPHSRSIDDLFQLEEERRLFYVGITRARKKLYITHARRRFIFGRRGEAMKSRFLGGETVERIEEPSW